MLAALWSEEAAAQTSPIVLGEANIARRRADAAVGSNYNYRDARRWWISRRDCEVGEVFDFPITLRTPMDELEVWAGSGEDCASIRGREDRGQSCWIVEKLSPRDDSFTVTVPVRNVVARQVGTLEPPSGLGEEVCRDSEDDEGDEITFYFFLQDGGQAVEGSAVTWNAQATGGTGFDLVGPAPPGSISVGMGENQLSIGFGDLDTDPDRERFSAYCEPTMLGLEGQCLATELIQGGDAPLDYYCGEAGETSGSIRADDVLGGPLMNDQTYAVAIAGEDVLGNPGKLSEVKCGTPVELDDFYEVYTRAGGAGGGGFCSMSSGMPRSAPGALGLLGVALAALRLRRGRRSS